MLSLRQRLSKNDIMLSFKVQISLWGYKESTIEPKLVYIHQLEEVPNNGKVRIDPKEFSNNDDGPEARSCRMGMIMVNLTRSAMANLGLPNSPMIWSKPIPLGWYFNAQWKRYLGSNFVEAMCDKFIREDREWKNFAYELPTVGNVAGLVCVLHLITNIAVPVFAQAGPCRPWEICSGL